MPETKLLTPPNYMNDLFALHKDLSEMHFIKTADNPYFKSKYIDYPSLLEQVKPVLLKHNFIWLTRPTTLNGEPAMAYELAHKSDSNITGTMLLNLKSATPQDQGSALTYARRYALTAVLDIAADEDDDGNKATDAAKAKNQAKADADIPVKEETKTKLYLILKKIGTTPDDYQKTIGKTIDSMTELEAVQAAKALIAEATKQAAS